MNDKVKLFFIIIVVYFFVRIISKYKVVEGVDGSSEGGASEPPSDPVREPCTVEDVINNNRGECLNGTVVGIKVDGDISDCSCDCNDGMRNRNHFLKNSTITSCRESDNIGDFQCYTECKNEQKIFKDIIMDDNSDKKEICNWVENMLDNCGRKCTLEGGGTTISDNLVRKQNNEDTVWLANKGYCKISYDKMTNLLLDGNFIRLLYYCQLFKVSKFKYRELIKLSDDEINNLFTNTTENFNSLKQELIEKIVFSCNDMDLGECIKKYEENLIIYADSMKFYKTKLYTKEFTIYNFLEVFTKMEIIDSLQRKSKSKYVEEIEETEILTKLRNTIQILVGLNADDGNIKVSDFDERYYHAIDKIDEQIDKSDLDKNLRNLYISNLLFGTEETSRGILELIGNFLCIKYSDKYDYENSNFNISNEKCITYNKNKCTENINFDDNVICKRLKYDKNMDENTPKDECCDIAWYENAWYWITDLF